MAKNFRERQWMMFKNEQGNFTRVGLSGEKRVTDAQGEFAIESFHREDQWEDIPAGVRTAIDDAWTTYFTWLQSTRN
jgi:hypothetical protein